MTTKKSFIVYIDTLECLEDLTNEQAGLLLRAMRSYHMGEDIDLPFELKPLFRLFQNQFVRDEEKYKKTCERNRENAQKRWNRTDATVCERMQTDAKHADNDSDNDNDSDKNNPPKPPKGEFNPDKFLHWFNTTKQKITGKHSNIKTLTKRDINNLKQLKNNHGIQDFNRAFYMMTRSDWAKSTGNITPAHFLVVGNFNRYLTQFDDLPHEHKQMTTEELIKQQRNE